MRSQAIIAAKLGDDYDINDDSSQSWDTSGNN
jgi:hypothetical protein